MRRPVLLFMLLIFLSDPLIANHLPENLIARGHAESMLGGINIHRSHVKELLARLGRPASYKKYPETEEWAEIIWDKSGSVVHATVYVDKIAHGVEVSGRAGPMTKTGAGLMLGGTVEDLERIYGRRFLRQGDTVTMQWADETELRVRFEGKHIVSIILLANME